MRTEDTSYGRDYFETLDNGAGYTDSPLWEDAAHIIKEVFAVGPHGDRSGELHAVDVGCAKGFLVRHLRRRGFDAWGVDISDYAIRSAPADTVDFLRLYDLTSPDPSFFGEDAFNFAVCLETMEHIPENQVDQALANIARLVEPGSQVLFAICTDKQPGWDSDPTHVTIRSRDWWTERLNRAGLVFTNEGAATQRRLGEFWLFYEHDGVFVTVKR